jgi:hypothetical protein
VTENPIENLEAFSSWLAAKGNKTKTIWSHRGRLLQIGRWYQAKHGKPLSPKAANPWIFDEYKNDTDWGDRAARSSLSHYADWAVEEGLLPYNPFRPFDPFEDQYRKILKDEGYANTTIRYMVGVARSFVTWYVETHRHQLGERPLPEGVVDKYATSMQEAGDADSTIKKHVDAANRFLSLSYQPLGLDIGALTLPYLRRLILSKGQIAALEKWLAQDPNDRRSRALLLLAEGVSATDVAAEIGVAVQTIYNWMHRFRSHLADGKPIKK